VWECRGGFGKVEVGEGRYGRVLEGKGECVRK